MPQPRKNQGQGGEGSRGGDAPKTPRDKAEAFRRVAGRRTNNVLKGIEQLQRTANRNTYEYSDDQVEKILTAVDKAVENLHSAFSAARRERSDFSL